LRGQGEGIEREIDKEEREIEKGKRKEKRERERERKSERKRERDRPANRAVRPSSDEGLEGRLLVSLAQHSLISSLSANRARDVRRCAFIVSFSSSFPVSFSARYLAIISREPRGDIACPSPSLFTRSRFSRARSASEEEGPTEGKLRVGRSIR